MQLLCLQDDVLLFLPVMPHYAGQLVLLYVNMTYAESA